MRAIAGVLDKVGADPGRMLALTTFNLALGNADAHAKEHLPALPRRAGHPRARLRRRQHAHYEPAEHRFATDVAGRRAMSELIGDDLLSEATSRGLSTVRATRLVAGTLGKLQAALDDLDRGEHPGVSDLAWSMVYQRVRALQTTAPATPRGARRLAPSRGPAPRREGHHGWRGSLPESP